MNLRKYMGLVHQKWREHRGKLTHHHIPRLPMTFKPHAPELDSTLHTLRLELQRCPSLCLLQCTLGTMDTDAFSFYS